MKAVRIAQHGPPSCMQIIDIATPLPEESEVLVRHEAIGVNFKDIYQRNGLYPLQLPSGLGFEAAGIVEAMGPKASNFKVGDRVAFGYGTIGAYAEAHIVDERTLVPIPEEVCCETAAAVLTKGLTADYLVNQTCKIKADEIVLIYAAAGGVGSILTQLALSKSARVIAVVGNNEKRDFVHSLGCECVINYRDEDIAEKVEFFTDGCGVKIAYDSVGAATWDASVRSLAPRGILVSYGNSSGAVPPVRPLELAKKSLYLTRPSLLHYIAEREELLRSAASVFEGVKSGTFKVTLSESFLLNDVDKAHEFIEKRRSIGSVILKI